MNKVLFFALTLFCFSSFATECIAVRAAFDIGSGTTKLKVAKIDTCQKKIIKVLHESDRAVGYKQDLKQSQSNELSQSIIDEGIKKILELKNEASAYLPSSFLAVATSAFRTASNGANAAKEISFKTDLTISVISQRKEAEIGFVGASVLSKKSLKDVISWDIGGGSMQITSYEGNNEFDIYEGKLASVSFKNHLIEDIQKKNPKKVTTPNPISKENIDEALKSLSSVVNNTVQQSVLEKMKINQVEIIGIGGVHYYSLLKKLGLTDGYSRKDLENYILEHLHQDDEQLGGGKYVRTSLSNFILVYGFMSAMDIKYIKVAKVNLADGILLKPSLLIN